MPFFFRFSLGIPCFLLGWLIIIITTTMSEKKKNKLQNEFFIHLFSIFIRYTFDVMWVCLCCVWCWMTAEQFMQVQRAQINYLTRHINIWSNRQKRSAQTYNNEKICIWMRKSQYVKFSVWNIITTTITASTSSK